MEKDTGDSQGVPNRPFKNIEVVDNERNQICKVACMSCIRGHRTTSCGIASCRGKVFWTVKKPGRPSNSCTCAYRQAGGCKCNIARGQCTHKPKKGEKRSADCRCDEIGRLCCLLPAEAWPKLWAGGKPVVQFYANRQELEMEQVARQLREGSIPATPASEAASYANNGFSTPPSRLSSVQGFIPYPHQRQLSETSVLTPRFGMMGIGAPLGPEGHVGENVFDWGDMSTPAPLAPRDRQTQMPPFPQANHQPPLQNKSCCGSKKDSTAETLNLPDHKPSIVSQSQQHLPAQSCCSSSQTPSAEWQNPFDVRLSVDSQATLPVYNDTGINDFISNYTNYMMPSAMCQQCGRVGCHCSTCPPLMQQSNSHWGTVCARTHERMQTAPTMSQPISQPSQMQQAALQQPQPLPQELSQHLFSTPFQDNINAMEQQNPFQQQMTSMAAAQHMLPQIEDNTPASMPMLTPLQTQMQHNLGRQFTDPMMPQMSGPESPPTFNPQMHASFELSPHSHDPFDEYLGTGSG